MEVRRASFEPSKLASASLVMVGVHAAIRYGAEWAYAFGHWVGSN